MISANGATGSDPAPVASDKVAELPDPPAIFVVVGRKGQGKSEAAYLLWESWTGDRVAVDTTSDFINGKDLSKTHLEPETVDLDVPPPSHWPAHLREPDSPRLSLRYVPDHSAPDFIDDMDRVVGLAFSHGECLIVIEEFGLVAPSNGVRPNTRKALHMGRHQDLSMVLTMPRIVGVDPLGPAQADVIYAFDLPNPDDRKRLADIIGWDRRVVDDAMAELEDHGYLRFLVKDHELAIFPPLPLPDKPSRKRHAERHLEEEPHDAEIL